ncbi:MAG TPA: hypothetical protein VJ596_12150 [Gemmatimonadaceae bacterium]|nr:hypothetical protein [Gemmatimonadaceae bacterium]
MRSLFRVMVCATVLASAFVLGACPSDDDDITGIVPPGDAEVTSDITEDRTFHAETTYTLTGFVHVGDGVTLTIEPGTTILGALGSALFILPGGQLIADGRADAPIVFTSDQPAGSRRPGDWGGLILVGRGIINRGGAVELEGTGTSSSNVVVRYDGGTNNADNSGILRYVRVEFAGFGPAPNQELNSFTLAAVGSGTTIEHVQALAGLDDSFEWFGGAVDGRFLVSYESGDDHFDASEGYIGRNQHLIAFQSTFLDPRAGAGQVSGDPQGFEVDNCGSASGSGCGAGFNSQPLTVPLFANFTLVGAGVHPFTSGNSGGIGMVLRRGAGGYYVNGIVARWPRAALSLRDPETQARFTAGDAVLRNVSVVEAGAAAGTNAPLFESGSGRFTIDAASNEIVAEPGTLAASAVFAALPPTSTSATAASLDFSLAPGAAARTGGLTSFAGSIAAKGGTFVTGTSYRGAWDPAGGKWWDGWTSYALN